MTASGINEAFRKAQAGSMDPNALVPPPGPEPPRRFEPGTILTLRMRGHSRSPVSGQDYFAPAVVLDQFLPGGEISVLIWDSSAGTHYNASYAIRELGVRGSGNEREMYVLTDNIGEVLFSPEAFASLCRSQDSLREAVYVMTERANRNHDDLVLAAARVAALETKLAEFPDMVQGFIKRELEGVTAPAAPVVDPAHGATKDKDEKNAKRS
jgi:hypothetical protein